MSLILEALRKSEADRRRGLAPNLYAELPPSPLAQRRRIPLIAWLLLAGAVILIMLWLARGMLPQQHAPEATVDATVRVAARPHSSAKAAVLPPVSRLLPTPVAPASVTPTAAPPVDTPAAVQSSAPAAPQVATLPPPLPQPFIAAPLPAPADNNAAQLSDLSVDERKSLPPLKLSMHLWNDDPSQRFVIVDGTRLREGDRIGDAVVTAITTDGVVLDWHGRRLKLPIR